MVIGAHEPIFPVYIGEKFCILHCHHHPLLFTWCFTFFFFCAREFTFDPQTGPCLEGRPVVLRVPADLSPIPTVPFHSSLVKMLPLTRMILLIPLLAALVASGEFCFSNFIFFQICPKASSACVFSFFSFTIIPTEIGSSVDEAYGYHVLKTSCRIDF